MTNIVLSITLATVAVALGLPLWLGFLIVFAYEITVGLVYITALILK